MTSNVHTLNSPTAARQGAAEPLFRFREADTLLLQECRLPSVSRLGSAAPHSSLPPWYPVISPSSHGYTALSALGSLGYNGMVATDCAVLFREPTW